MLISVLDLAQWFYLFMFMDLCMSNPMFSFSPSGERLRRDIREFYDKLCAKFAEALYNYIIYACCREMKHAEEFCSHTPMFILGKRTDTISRMGIRERIHRCDPVYVLRFSEHIFGSFEWNRSFGGEKWCKAAKLALQYGKISNVLFIDRIIDLQHNTGSLFSKDNPYFVGRDDSLKGFLTCKTMITDEFELATFLISESSLRWTREIRNIVYRFLILYGSKFYDDPDKLGWGWENYADIVNRVLFWPIDKNIEKSCEDFFNQKSIKYTYEFNDFRIVETQVYHKKWRRALIPRKQRMAYLMDQKERMMKKRREKKNERKVIRITYESPDETPIERDDLPF